VRNSGSAIRCWPVIDSSRVRPRAYTSTLGSSRDTRSPSSSISGGIYRMVPRFRLATPKSPSLRVPVRWKQDVPRFDVVVNDFISVDESKGLAKLQAPCEDLLFGEATCGHQPIMQTSARAELHHQVKAIFVFEMMVKGDYVRMTKLRQRLHLPYK